jgi:phage terminase large subunit-like protein
MTGHPGIPSPLNFFGRLLWLDGRPLMDTIEEYRREFFLKALYSFRPDMTPLYNLVLAGRGKKNNKTTDLVLSAFYRMLCWESYQGNDAYILANDIGQAADDLSLAKKIVYVNPEIAAEVVVMDREIRRRDGKGKMEILPSRDAVGQHGKTALFLGFDEIHGYKNWDLFEALAPDPTRPDTLTWITSYDTIYNSAGVPLFDLKKTGLEGSDPRMLFQWYSADLCTDPAFKDLPAEQRANPSMDSWPEGAKYLEQQRRRLPSHKFRRLHLNLHGAPNGAFFDGDSIMKSIVTGLKRIPPDPTRKYFAWCDMSGGSCDDACLAIAHFESGRRVLDLVESQTSGVPFNPRRGSEVRADLTSVPHGFGNWRPLCGPNFPHGFCGPRYPLPPQR